MIETSTIEGFDFLVRLREEYISGANRFDLPGEVLLGIYAHHELIAVGGLNQDPYSGIPRTGRLRHTYVLPSWRGRGVGRILVKALVEHARFTFDRLVLRTDTTAAGQFYQALGFVAAGQIPGATHWRSSTGLGSVPAPA